MTGRNVDVDDSLNRGSALNENDKLAPGGRAVRNGQLNFTPGYPHLGYQMRRARCSSFVRANTVACASWSSF